MANNSGFPSLTALLGLLAIAGYQNRDKIGELLRGTAPGQNTAAGSQAGGQGLGGQGFGGLFSGIQNLGAGGLLSGGLSELLKKFQQAGMGDTADSWVKSGPNQQTSAEKLEAALGPDVIGELEQKTGLSRAEILARLAKELPDAVDKYTPEGRMPPV